MIVITIYHDYNKLFTFDYSLVEVYSNRARSMDTYLFVFIENSMKNNKLFINAKKTTSQQFNHFLIKKKFT